MHILKLTIILIFTACVFGLNNAATAAQPALFGSREIRNDDITAFNKWVDVMARFDTETRRMGHNPPRHIAAWQAEINRLRDKPVAEQISGVNDFLNQVPYRDDIDNYGQTDYWATPVEFLTRGGDCEDFAIAKYLSLRALGFSEQQLRIAIVQDQIKNVPHAVLIVYSNAGNVVLDNQVPQVTSITVAGRYRPIFSINATNWWLHNV